MWCYAGNPVDLGGTNWRITPVHTNAKDLLNPEALHREEKAGNERPLDRRQERVFKISGASNPRPPRSPQNTGELINELLQQRVFDPLDVRLRL